MPGRFDARYGGHGRSQGIEQLFDWNNRSLDTLRALSELTDRMAPLRGRKTLLWVSTEFPGVINGGVVPGARSAEVVYLDLVARALARFNRWHITVHTINTSGLGGTGRSYSATLRDFAERTGGIPFSDCNDLAEGVRAALDDIENGYVLGFRVPEGSTPGVHTINVRTSRRRVSLKFRRTYELAR